MDNQGKIIIYQPEDTFQLEVRLENETVWLTLNQISSLFDRDKSVISRHINNIFKEKELDYSETVAKNATVQQEGKKQVLRQIEYYNLDIIISVGYRVKSLRGTQFRIWANRILKEYLMTGYALSYRIDKIERKLIEHDQKFDFLIKTSLPPHEGIFYDGRIFDAYQFISNLIKSATESIVLIDNYIDESVLTLLSKCKKGVDICIYTQNLSKQLKLDLERFQAQYFPIEVKIFSKSHDRFLIIDNQIVYHIGASLKDAGKKWFAFSKIGLAAREILKNIN